MVLLDSNIVIYAAQPQYQQLFEYLQGFELGVSQVTQVEVLGYHLLPTPERNLFERFFSSIVNWPVTDPVIRQAIQIRQTRKTSLGDSLIAATALVHEVPLFTRNKNDFLHIAGLSVRNPLEEIGAG